MYELQNSLILSCDTLGIILTLRLSNVDYIEVFVFLIFYGFSENPIVPFSVIRHSNPLKRETYTLIRIVTASMYRRT